MDRPASPPRRRPGPLARRLFHAPALLYRLRLGRLLGHRFLMVSHRGRRTGRVRRTVLEVVRHDPATGESVVASGWGETSDWYRNIRAAPALEVRTGWERYVPEQRFLDAGEAYRELSDYEHRHPLAARLIPRALSIPYDGSESGRRALAAAVCMVSFRPAGSPSAAPGGDRGTGGAAER